MILLTLVKNQFIMAMDAYEVEENRSLFMFVLSIMHLFFKIIAFGIFILQFWLYGRMPYGILKSLMATTYKLYGKLKLFAKYLKLLRDLNSIEETEVLCTCAICTDEITKGKKLKCSHVFHSKCLKMWCEKEVSCPICRAELVFKKEIVFETEDEVLSVIPVEIEES